MYFEQDVVARAQGCLIGQIAGDALGALVEFKTRAEIAVLYPGRLSELAAGGPWNIIAGQPTDDSELALALARQLVHDGFYNRPQVFAAYQAWLASGPFDIGVTTSAALKRSLDEAAPNESQANGSLMRVSPIGIFAAGQPALAAELGATDSRLTHPHPVCVAACASFTAAISIGIATGSRPAMIEAACRFAGPGEAGDTIRRVLATSARSPPLEYQHQMGWVLIALQNAFHQLRKGHCVGEAVVDTVAQGGDTDTNGAIAGALAGAADGLAAIPSQWIHAVSACRPGREDVTVHQPRPAAYWPDQAQDLARQLLKAGVLLGSKSKGA